MQCGLGSSEIQSGSTRGILNLQGWALSSLCSDACRPRGCLICASATSYEINTNNEQQNRAITAGHFEFMWARSEMLMVSGPQKTKGPETPGSKAVDQGAALTLAFRVKVLCWFCPHRPECAHKQVHRHTVTGAWIPAKQVMGVVVHTFNSSSQKAEADGSLWVQNQHGLLSEFRVSQGYNETLSKNKPRYLVASSSFSPSCGTYLCVHPAVSQSLLKAHHGPAV